MIILQDDREKAGWDLSMHGSVVRQRLETGDYTIQGFERQICIERKGSTAEISLNLGKFKKRFEDEFRRMSEIRFNIVICEFPMSRILEFPKNSGVPRKVWPHLKMNGKFILNSFTNLSEKYGVELYFANNPSEAADKASQFIFNALNILEYEDRY